MNRPGGEEKGRSRSEVQPPDGPRSRSRRAFLRGAGVATAATLTSATVGLDSLFGGRSAQAQTVDDSQSPELFLDSRTSAADMQRRNKAFQKRENAANAEKRVAIPAHPVN